MRFRLLKVIKFGLCILLLSGFFIQNNAQAEEINLFSDKAITILADSGEVVYEKNANITDFPASTTKVMTAIIMMDYIKENEAITMSARSLQEEKSNSQILFSEGEKLDRNTAIKTMMILSANDLAYAIGETVAGDMNSFVKMMNERAKKIGASHTHFTNPNGLHNDHHYTTAYDLALIAKEALKYPLIIKAMGTKEAQITTSKQMNKYIFNRGNMFTNPYFLAGKTGYTNTSRNTLIEIDQKDGQKIINILLRSSKPQYLNDIKLLDAYAFPRIYKKVIVKEEDWKKELKVKDTVIQTKISTDLSFLTAKNPNTKYEVKVKQEHALATEYKKNGLHKNQKIGKVEVLSDGKIVTKADLLTAKSYDRPTFFTLNTILIAGIVIVFLIIVLFTRPRRKRVYIKSRT